MSMVNDCVAFDAVEGIEIIGRVTREHEATVEVTEAHAFHPYWGGSNAGRGTIHHLDKAAIREDKRYKHITNKHVPAV